MASSSNKLVDKYQYNQSQVRVQGLVQIITAKHIVLKQLYTLKKINISNPNTLTKYHGVINQMNVLKTLGSSAYIFKCHKMLKTSNNLYVVYDLMGRNPSLYQYLNSQSQIDEQKKKSIAKQILAFLKELEKINVCYLNMSSKNIQIDQKGQIRFVNLESGLSLVRNASSLLFQNVQPIQESAPQLKQFISSCTFPYEKEIDVTSFSQKLRKADIYGFGQVLRQVYAKQLNFLDSSQGKGLFSSQSIQTSIKKLVREMKSQNPSERPSLDQIGEFFIGKLNDLKKPKTKLLRFQRGLQVSQAGIQLSKSASKLNTAKTLVQKQYLSPIVDDDFDRKSARSIKSSVGYNSTTQLRLKSQKGPFVNIQSEGSTLQLYKMFVFKVIKRRNLCKFLLKSAKILFSLQLIDQTLRIMLSFMLIKKSVLLVCSLARYISTGKGQSQQFDFKDLIRKQFSKTSDFFKLSVSINKQMDSARSLYQSCINQINKQFHQICQIKEFDFSHQCKSQKLNQKFMKQVIKKSIHQMLRRIHVAPKGAQGLRRVSKNFLNDIALNNFLMASNSSISQNKLLDVDEASVSVKSARTVKSNLSGSSVGQITIQNYPSQTILRIISHEALVYTYLMALILDFQSYEKMFKKMIVDQQILFQKQSLMKQLQRMQARQIAFKMHQMVN